MALVKRLIYVFKATAVKGVIKSKTCLRESVIMMISSHPTTPRGGVHETTQLDQATKK